MTNRWLKLLSIFVSLVLIFNLLPLQVLASDINDALQPSLSVLPDDGSSGSTESYERLDTLTVVEEDASRRGEYYKEFVLNNCLRLAAVYTEPVHYTDGGEWKDIDNTLKAVSIKGISGYTNTAGVWQVYFPQQLSGSNAISLTKDGYTVSFGMAGELTNSGNIAVASIGSTAETLSVSTVNTATAQLRAVDLSAQKAAAQYEQTVLEKHSSRLAYASVYDNTEIVYDLSGNRLKESIVMAQYDSSLWGYRYNLNTGGLIPVLLDDNTIELRHPETAEVVMTMPAPFMVDANYEYSYDVDVSLVQKGSSYLLSYYVPRAWLASADRAWPVVLDPVIGAGTGSSNIQDISFTPTVTETRLHSTLKVGLASTNGTYRTYMRFLSLPVLNSADYIAKATVAIYKPTTTSKSIPVEVHRANQTWTDRTIAWGTNDTFNEIVEDYVIAQNAGWYEWDVTGIVRGWYEDPVNSLANNTGLMFKTTDAIENGGISNWHQFCSSNYANNVSGGAGTSPQLVVVFRNSNGLERYWNYTSSSAGRAGTGYINNFTGGVTWVHSDIGFGGNRMPVSISHIYNTGEASSDAFNMGYGWRTNFNQSVKAYSSGIKPYYVWEDSDGTQHYFYQTDENENTYQDEDGLDLTLTVSGEGIVITDKLGNTSHFDAQGRLYELRNNQQTKSSIIIEYNGATSRITKVIDGVGREYRFTYDSSQLTRIGYYSTGETEIAHIAFSYTNNNLIAITYQDSTADTPKQSRFEYDTNHRMTEARDVDGYSLEYTYTLEEMGKPIKVAMVTEYSRNGESPVKGWEYSFSYAHNQTAIRDQHGVEQILYFNNWGNVTSVQDDQGRAQFDIYDSNSVTNDSGKHLNQINKSSRLQDTVVNLLKDSSFEQGTLWEAGDGAIQTVTTENAYLGNNSLQVVSVDGTQVGVTAFDKFVAPFSSYTFSAYVKTGTDTSAYIAISGGGITAVSETLSGNQGWTFLQANFYNSTGAPQTICAYLMVDGANPVYIDCAQMEEASTASRYNLIDNGNFNFGSDGWIMSENCDTDEKVVVISEINEDYEHTASQIGGYVFQIVGDPTSKLRIRQELPVSGEAGDAYVLSGWALGQGVPLRETDSNIRTYTLRGQFLYTDDTTGVFETDFNPTVDGCWQHTATAMVAEKPYNGIKIQVLFDYAANTVYFDSIQLFKESFGSEYEYDNNTGDLISVKDSTNETTAYQYLNSNLTQITLPTGTKMTYTYDGHHNVKTATSEEGVVYTYEYDQYGNNTSVSITVQDVCITSRVAYTEDGNRMVSSTDAAGNVTTYSYNADTNLLEWTKAPGETDSTRTNYTYDAMYRLAGVSANVSGLSESTALTAAYSYTNDLLTSLQTSSTTYTFTYGDFALRTGVNIGSRILANYRYNDKHELERLDYGNGDSVNYYYDRQGRLTQQQYEDDAYITYKYDNSGLQSYVYDSATNTTTRYYYDFADRLGKVEQASPYASHTVEYNYNRLSNPSYIDDTVNGVTHTTLLGYNGDNQLTLVSAPTGRRFFEYDEYGRLTQRRSVTANDVLTETFSYRSLSSAALTGQISSHTLRYGNGLLSNFSYQYDEKGNIISVSNFGTTTYVYDSQGQLIRENNQAANRTWTYQYDDAGNIVYKREYAYTTGELGTPVSISYREFTDPDWGDLMTVYNGTTITYDEIGNPLNDGTRTYTWQHGRQLAGMTSSSSIWSFTYGADGMRTRRSNGIHTYNYVYTGGNLVYMTVDTNALRIGYDLNGTPIGLQYNGVLYFYVTNLQGDIIAILNTSGEPVVNYTYDAWGNILSTTGSMASTLGVHNPLRYRGYVYDQETGLYYLQTRYYNPQWGRFLNADAFASTGQGLTGNNMFAYCGNNPVNFADTAGTRREYVRDIAAISHYVPVVGSSGGKMGSDDLLQYLKEQGAGNTGDTYRYTVQYVGVYTKKTDYTADYMRLIIASGLFAASFVPGIREAAWASIAMQAHSGLELFLTGIDLHHKSSDSFPDKDYYQYRVTLSFYEDIQYNGRTYRTLHHYEIYYVWNDASYSNPHWQILKGKHDLISYYVD